MKLREQLKAAVEELSAVGAIVFDPHGKELCRVGPLEQIASDGLFGALFGGPAAVARLRDSLEGQLLPQIWSQGTIDCFVSRRSDGVVWGVFSQRPLDAVALYQASQDTARIVESRLRF